MIVEKHWEQELIDDPFGSELDGRRPVEKDYLSNSGKHVLVLCVCLYEVVLCTFVCG